jgi:hypothetical protein
MKINNIKIIDCNDWDKLVIETYGRPYCFQQQNGCQNRGLFELSIPSDFTMENEMNNFIPEEVNGGEMGVKFEVWLARDPKQPIKNQNFDWENSLFWERNFYPDIYTIANNLHTKGLIKAGKYGIKIDW